MSYQYFVVPFQGQIKASGNLGQVSAQLQAVINQHASQGLRRSREVSHLCFPKLTQTT